jgi:hypothetical protein
VLNHKSTLASPSWNGETFEGNREFAFGERLAEDHLAINAPIDLVVDVFEAGPSQIA